MTPIRIGIIGAGWVVRNRHLPAIKKIPDAEVGWIWSRNTDKANQVAAEHGIGRVLKEWQEVIDTPEIDAVVVATPPVLHATVTLAALKSGKHVLSQARMARNLKEAQEMTQAAQASTLVTALYPARPGLKGHRAMLRLLHEEKFVGELREVRVTGMELAEGKKEYAWASDPDVVGVNAMNLGMWVEVLNRWIGPAKSVSATAKIHHQKRKAYGGDWVNAAVPDSLAVVAELECGATASYHLSTCAACGPATGVEIYGSRGALAYQFFADEIRAASVDNPNWEPIAILPEEASSQTTDSDFIQAIRTGARVSPDFSEGLRYMEFLEAVAFSVETGSIVAIPGLQPKMQCWGRLLDRHVAQH